jgi:inner membrane protein
MLAKTHLAITLFFALLLSQFVQNPSFFIVFSLFFTLFPDIDSKFSRVGKGKIFRLIQIFLKHRGILHSFIFLFFVSFLLFLFFPMIALPFFVGYGIHLISDSFTVSGIRLFYPLNIVYYGAIKTGGSVERVIFILFLIANLFYLTSIIFS